MPIKKHIKNDTYFELFVLLLSSFIVSLINIDKLPNNSPIKTDFVWIGIIIGSLFFMKIIQMLLNKYHSQTMFGIIGFGLGSIFILYPNYSLNISSLISIILLILGYYIGKNIKQER